MVAFDATTNGSSGTGSLSFSHTCTGTSRVLIATIVAAQATDGTPNPTVTYNSVSMTLLGKQIPGATLRNMFVFYLINPATGSNTFSCTLNGSGAVNLHEAILVSYTGVKQTGFPDSSNTGSVSLSAFDPWSSSTTVVSSGGWMATSANGRPGTVNQTSGLSRNLIDSSSVGVGDSNTIVGIGSQTISFSASAGSPVYDWVAWSMAPDTTIYTLTTTVGSFSLTGISIGLGKVFRLVVNVGNIILTGINATLNLTGTHWLNRPKNSSTYINQTKHSSAFLNQSKNSSSWGNRPKH